MYYQCYVKTTFFVNKMKDQSFKLDITTANHLNSLLQNNTSWMEYQAHKGQCCQTPQECDLWQSSKLNIYVAQFFLNIYFIYCAQ